ncbi:MAG TPA: RNA polymerase subunit sigma-24, partial [Candidatus Limnocylindria bacterium]|nr:RNA polymerase subunit sigma-24 [Candidatus Limnocylindria bacterium]
TRASVTRAFLDATRSGDVASLMEILAPDVALVADSGGLAPAPPRPLLGARKVARFMVAIAARPIPALAAAVVELNGEPAVLVSSAGEPVAAFFPQVVDGRVMAVHVQANPEKLRRLASHVT